MEQANQQENKQPSDNSKQKTEYIELFSLDSSDILEIFF